jgi:endonuclease YncB( thermonuclease family)
MSRARIFLTIIFVLALAVTALAADDRTQTRPSLERVTVDPALVEVGDGDTVVIDWGDGDRERVRILGIDTPEVAHHSMGWYDDQPYGRRATAFAEGVFAAAQTVELLRAAETDGYGRTLGYLFVNGFNYSVLVIKAGYAVETVGHYGDNGLPAEADEVLAAWREVAPVPFEAPYRFRRRMRELNDWREAQAETADTD